MSEMQGLLLRWETLEPERCRFVRGLSAQVRLGSAAQNIHVGASGDSGAIIQAAVQEAITARGLSFAVYGYNPAKNWTDSATVGGGGKHFRAEGGSHAENLLSAYLQALQAL